MATAIDHVRAQPGTMRARTSFERTVNAPTLVRVRTEGDWPAGEFRDYFLALMTNAGIANIADLARRADIDPSLISKWLNGRQQPSRRNLKKVAGPFGVPPVNMYLAAGLDDEEDLDISGQYDLSAIAPEYRALLDLDRDEETTPAVRAFLRECAATLVAGVRARRGEERAGRPIGRRRTA